MTTTEKFVKLFETIQKEYPLTEQEEAFKRLQKWAWDMWIECKLNAPAVYDMIDVIDKQIEIIKTVLSK